MGEPQIGNLFIQIKGDLGIRQHLPLLIEDTREQQTASEHIDLLVQVALGLGDAFQPSFDLDVFLPQIVDLLGGFNEPLTQLLIDPALFFQNRILLDSLPFAGGISDRLVRVGQPFGVDPVLYQLDAMLQLLYLHTGQILAFECQILQVGVVIQRLLLLIQLQGQQMEFGDEQLALTGFEVVFACHATELVANILGPVVGLAHAGLGAFRQGLQRSQLTAGIGKFSLQSLLILHLLGDPLLQLG